MKDLVKVISNPKERTAILRTTQSYVVWWTALRRASGACHSAFRPSFSPFSIPVMIKTRRLFRYSSFDLDNEDNLVVD